MKRILYFLMTLSILGCESSNSDITDLEGSWVSQCSDFGNIPNTSKKIIYTFHGNSLDLFVDVYDDSTCANFSNSTPFHEYYFAVNQNYVPIIFSIGASVTTLNGVVVKEIDLITSGEVSQNIYLLQDNSNTLFFGLQCDDVGSSCTTSRPNEINYNEHLVKI